MLHDMYIFQHVILYVHFYISVNGVFGEPSDLSLLFTNSVFYVEKTYFQITALFLYYS